MPNSAQDKKLVIIMHRLGRNIVWPPYVVVKPGEEIQFKAVNTEANIFLPLPDIFEDDFGTVTGSNEAATPVGRQGEKELRISKGRGYKRLKLKTEAALKALSESTVPGNPYTYPGIYPYSVFCSNGSDFAEGNTTPVLILEPPDEKPPN